MYKRMQNGKKRVLSMLLALVLTAVCAVSGVQASSEGSAISEAKNGVVRILCVYTVSCEFLEQTAELDSWSSYSVGSAFGVGDAGKETQYFVTNRHVVADESETYTLYNLLVSLYGESDGAALAAAYQQYYSIDPTTYEVALEYTLVRAYILEDDYAFSSSTGLDTSRITPCDVVAVNDEDEADLAVLKSAETVEGRVALALAPAEDGSVEGGDTVYAIGYPVVSDYMSLDSDDNINYAASVEESTVTSGVVSRLTTYEEINDTVIQHSAEINGGNSGGPLLNEDGAVIGVNAATFSSSDSSVSSYYISMTSDEVMELLDDNDISYDVYKSGIGLPVIIGIVAALIVIIAAVLVLVLLKSKSAKKRTGTQGQQAFVQGQPYAQGQQPYAQGNPGAQGQQPYAQGNSVVQGQQPYSQGQPGAQRQQPYAQGQSGAQRQQSDEGTVILSGDSGYRIQCTRGVFAGRRFAIIGRLRIGRDPERNELVFPRDTRGISGVHCVLTAANGQVTITDLNSTYGTFLGQGQRIPANQPYVLRIGDTFCLGSADEAFVVTPKGGI